MSVYIASKYAPLKIQRVPQKCKVPHILRPEKSVLELFIYLPIHNLLVIVVLTCPQII